LSAHRGKQGILGGNFQRLFFDKCCAVVAQTFIGSQTLDVVLRFSSQEDDNISSRNLNFIAMFKTVILYHTRVSVK
jgi:hypothetical protein